MANISMDPRHTNYLRQNIVFSYPKMIRVSFSLFLCLSVFCYFTLLLIFIKIVLLSLLFYLFIFMKMFFFSCSGMFRNVPACSGMFHVPGFIDAHIFGSLITETRLVIFVIVSIVSIFKRRIFTHKVIYRLFQLNV